MAEISSLVRVGIVSDVRKSEGTARVYYPDMHNMVSDWLHVMRYPNMRVSVTVENNEGHSHDAYASITDWFPKVNDKVLVLMAYGFNSDGFILGVIE